MGYTLYFPDRPGRLTGTVRTSTFLNDLGFSPQDPPNPALVVQTNEAAPDQEDILVVELLNPEYDAATDIVTYDVRFLDDYSESTCGSESRRKHRRPRRRPMA